MFVILEQDEILVTNFVEPNIIIVTRPSPASRPSSTPNPDPN